MRNTDVFSSQSSSENLLSDGVSGPAEKKVSYKKIIQVFLSGWYFIVAALLIALAIAYVSVRSSERIYSSSSVIRIENEKNDLSLEATSQIQLYRPKVDLESETFVIKSREVMENAVKRLNYQVSYFVKGRVRNTDVYPESPFTVVIQDSISNGSDFFEVEPKSADSFILTYHEQSFTYSYNRLINIEGFKFKIFKGLKPLKDKYLFRINTPQTIIQIVAPLLAIQPYSKNSNIISLNINYSNPHFGADILNAILAEYTVYNAKSKQRAASQMIEFIDDQLDLISGRVQSSENALESYRRSNGIIDLGESSSSLSNRLADLEAQKMNLKLQALTIEQLEEQLKQNRERVTINLGLDVEASPGLTGILNQFNSLIVERNRLLTQFNENSINITQIDNQIRAIREAAATNIRHLKERNNKTAAFIDNQIMSSRNTLSSIPGAERKLFSLTANNEINQKVYNFLNEKKLSAQISRASTVSDISIIEHALPNLKPISPVPADAYKKAILFGLISGVLLILLIRQLYPYITDKAFVETHTTIPILGVIRKFPEKIDENNSQVLTATSPKSAFAESVRSVRTNLSFFSSEKNNKIICVTSELAGEGKSFTSLNLASTLSLIDKKVMLIAADLRRSKLHKTFELKSKMGLSEYLSYRAQLPEIINDTNLDNLSFISSGSLPPNPSELLHSERMTELLKELLQNYHYVIVDTAPVGLISDAIPLIRQADINLFVIRAGVSKHTAATLPAKIANELKLKNVSIVLNEFENRPLFASFYSTDFAESGYYGYYYYSDYSAYSSYLDVEKKPWYKRLFSS